MGTTHKINDVNDSTKKFFIFYFKFYAKKKLLIIFHLPYHIRLHFSPMPQTKNLFLE